MVQLLDNGGATTASSETSVVAWPWRLYAAVATYLGVLIVAGTIAATAAAVAFLPDLSSPNGFQLLQLVPSDTASLQTQATEDRIFGASLSDSPAMVVEHDPSGYSPTLLLRALQQAQTVDRGTTDATPTQPVGALPLTNLAPLAPSHGTATTIVTYLFFGRNAQSSDIEQGASAYAAHAPHPAGSSVGVTGDIPAQLAEGDTIENTLVLLEAATIALIALLIGAMFRSPIAAAVPLSGAGIAYLIARHVLSWLAARAGVVIPSQLAPILIVLVLGVVTDYSVFFMASMRARLADGESRGVSLRRSAARVVPLVIAAALTVAAGAVALVGSGLGFFRAVGPGLAVAVLLSGLVSVVYVPALLGVLGRFAFWPGLSRSRGDVEAGSRAGMRLLIARMLSRRPAAAATALVCTAALLLAARGLTGGLLGAGIVSDLPGDSEPRQAAAAAGEGFVPGIIAPATLLLQGPHVTASTAGLLRLEATMRASPGVAAVYGPDLLPGGLGNEVFDAPNGSAARLVVVFRDDPYDAAAIGAYARLSATVAATLHPAGLDGVTTGWSGATPTAAEASSALVQSSWRVGLIAAALMLLVLGLWFRAVVAPLLLIISSALAVAATLGLLVYVFQGMLHDPDVTFFVPLTAGVLLVALGADYSVFVMGRIWEDAHSMELRTAVEAALPRASRAVSIAAAIMAASFALLALVPVQPFREFAFIMSAGVVVDAFVVRSLLFPALLVLAGRFAFWPNRLGLRP
ncbi:MAG: MMPL family transporter, partial [Candidatus Dormibacteraeota bacterium]|nr:MMPL family transporter [Candidatus Dormibacteraeota bacterium]